MTSIAYGPGEDPLNALYTLIGALDEAALASALADWVLDRADTRAGDDPDDDAADQREQAVTASEESPDGGDVARESGHGAVDGNGSAKGSLPDFVADQVVAANADPASATPTPNPGLGGLSTAALQALDAGETKTGSPASLATPVGSNDTDEPNDMDAADTDGPETGDADEAGEADGTDTDAPDDTETETGETDTGDNDETGDVDPVDSDGANDTDTDATATGGDAIADIAMLLHLQDLNEASQDPAASLAADFADSATLGDGTDLSLYAASTDVPAIPEHDLW